MKKYILPVCAIVLVAIVFFELGYIVRGISFEPSSTYQYILKTSVGTKEYTISLNNDGTCNWCGTIGTWTAESNVISAKLYGNKRKTCYVAEGGAGVIVDGNLYEKIG